MLRNKRISLLIPCYNEEEGIVKMLTSTPSFVDEVIIIDNGSTDNTTAVAKQYRAIVISEKKKGYGYAYQAGLAKAGGDIVVLLDGDNSYPLSEVEKLLLYLEKEHCDFVVGCRYPLINKNAQVFINKIANYFISWLIRTLFRVNIRDSQSGMIVFNKDILNKIKICNTGMGFSQEIKIKAFLHSDINCGEMRISYLPRTGEVKFRKIDAVRNLCSVLSQWLGWIQEKEKNEQIIRPLNFFSRV